MVSNNQIELQPIQHTTNHIAHPLCAATCASGPRTSIYDFVTRRSHRASTLSKLPVTQLMLTLTTLSKHGSLLRAPHPIPSLPNKTPQTKKRSKHQRKRDKLTPQEYRNNIQINMLIPHVTDLLQPHPLLRLYPTLPHPLRLSHRVGANGFIVGDTGAAVGRGTPGERVGRG